MNYRGRTESSSNKRYNININTHNTTQKQIKQLKPTRPPPSVPATRVPNTTSTSSSASASASAAAAASARSPKQPMSNVLNSGARGNPQPAPAQAVIASPAIPATSTLTQQAIFSSPSPAAAATAAAISSRVDVHGNVGALDPSVLDSFLLSLSCELSCCETEMGTIEAALQSCANQRKTFADRIVRFPKHSQTYQSDLSEVTLFDQDIQHYKTQKQTLTDRIHRATSLYQQLRPLRKIIQQLQLQPQLQSQSQSQSQSQITSSSASASASSAVTTQPAQTLSAEQCSNIVPVLLVNSQKQNQVHPNMNGQQHPQDLHGDAFPNAVRAVSQPADRLSDPPRVGVVAARRVSLPGAGAGAGAGSGSGVSGADVSDLIREVSSLRQQVTNLKAKHIEDRDEAEQAWSHKLQQLQLQYNELHKQNIILVQKRAPPPDTHVIGSVFPDNITICNNYEYFLNQGKFDDILEKLKNTCGGPEHAKFTVLTTDQTGDDSWILKHGRERGLFSGLAPLDVMMSVDSDMSDACDSSVRSQRVYYIRKTVLDSGRLVALVISGLWNFMTEFIRITDQKLQEACNAWGETTQLLEYSSSHGESSSVFLQELNEQLWQHYRHGHNMMRARLSSKCKDMCSKLTKSIRMYHGIHAIATSTDPNVKSIETINTSPDALLPQQAMQCLHELITSLAPLLYDIALARPQLEFLWTNVIHKTVYAWELEPTLQDFPKNATLSAIIVPPLVAVAPATTTPTTAIPPIRVRGRCYVKEA